jgi:hypothetical protein
MLNVLVGALLLLLVGCAPGHYVKDGMTSQDFDKDHFDCEMRVVTIYGGWARMGAGEAIMAGQDIHRCLLTKGYRKVAAAQ